MPFTEFTCRAGGSNLNAGSLDGAAEVATAPLLTATNGDWNGTTGVFSKAGRAASFVSASSQSMSVADGASVRTGNIAFWAAAWVRLTTKLATAGIVYKGNTSGGTVMIEWGIGYASSLDRFNFTVGNGGSSAQSATANTLGPPATGTWYFVFAWYDPVAAKVYISVNGQATPDEAAVGFTPATGTRPLNLGTIENNNIPASFLNGALDSACFGKMPAGFVTTPAANIIASLYNGGAGKPYSALTSGEKAAWGLVSYWDFETLTADSHGANTLTNTNAVTQTAGVVSSDGTTNFATDGVAVGQWVSLLQDTANVPFSGASGGIPAGWSAKWDASNVTWAENAGGFLRCTVGVTGRHALGCDAVPSVNADVELLVKMRTSSSPSGSSGYCGIAWKGSGSAGAENGYRAILSTASGVPQINLGRLVAGSFPLGISANFTWVANTWYWMRVRNVGAVVLIRVWADGTAEPSTWNIDTVDIVTAAGFAGVYCGSPAASVDDFDDFSVTPINTNYVARVTAVTPTTITLSASSRSGTAPTTTASGLTARVGGAWQGPNGVSGFPFGFVANVMTDAASNPPRINLKNDQTHSLTAAATHALPGTLRFEGYTSSFGDGGRAEIVWSNSGGASYVPLTVSGQMTELANLTLTGTGTNNTGDPNPVAISGGACSLDRVVVRNFRSNNCTITAAGCTLVECTFYGGLTAGLLVSTSATLDNCMIYANTGATTDGLQINTGRCVLTDCVIDGNGRYGVSVTGTVDLVQIRGGVVRGNGGDGARLASSSSFRFYSKNVIYANNGGVGVIRSSGVAVVTLRGNAFRLNTGGNTNGLTHLTESGTITLTADPFVGAATGDFRLNTAAGGGALLKGTGRGAFTQTQSGYAGTVSYPDVGAAQHQEPTEAEVAAAVWGYANRTLTG